MNFKPPITKKHFSWKVYQQQIPFPLLEENQKFHGIFTGYSVDIFDSKEMEKIYDNGFYGKGSHSRSVPKSIESNSNEKNIEPGNILESLVLDLEETMFLSHFLEVLEVKDLQNKILDSESLYREFCEIKPNLIQYLVGYIYLKSLNWVVKSGLKFGGDFLIYKKGPRFHHASMIVLINQLDQIKNTQVQCVHRIAQTSKKGVLFLKVNYPANFEHLDRSQHLSVIDQFTVNETILERLIFNEFVQKKQK